MTPEERLKRFDLVRRQQPYVFSNQAIEDLATLDADIKNLSIEEKAEKIREYCLQYEDVRDAVISAMPSDYRFI